MSENPWFFRVKASWGILPHCTRSKYKGLVLKQQTNPLPLRRLKTPPGAGSLQTPILLHRSQIYL